MSPWQIASWRALRDQQRRCCRSVHARSSSVGRRRIFEVYERLLCRLSAGFIGWTPYLCGRAMTFGSPRAGVTAAGWPLGVVMHPLSTPRDQGRCAKLGIPQEDLVVGIVGALEWNAQKQYCYGWDLVECARRVKRQDVKFVIIGGGSGLDRLRTMAGTSWESEFPAW